MPFLPFIYILSGACNLALSATLIVARSSSHAHVHINEVATACKKRKNRAWSRRGANGEAAPGPEIPRGLQVGGMLCTSGSWSKVAKNTDTVMTLGSGEATCGRGRAQVKSVLDFYLSSFLVEMRSRYMQAPRCLVLRLLSLAMR